MSTPTIVTIHGAHSSPTSFNFIKQQLQDYSIIWTDITYDINDPIEDIIVQASHHIDGNCHIIAHSFGGVVAVALSQKIPNTINSITTLATPFGGVEAAARMPVALSFSPFLRNIHPLNPTLRKVMLTGAVVPTTNIITTGGNNELMLQANDGVVSVASQRALLNSDKIISTSNHFEVLLDYSTIRTIINNTIK